MKMHPRNRQILQIALPSIVSNITVPLLGLVDTAIVGHLGDAVYIGAIAVGSMIFNLVYWIFGFLRMGTSGLTAQARGRRDLNGAAQLLRRSVNVGLAVALGLLLLQWPLREVMLWLIGPTADIRPLATTYFNIVIWGAPAMLTLYGLTGWFIGMQNTRTPMFISIMQNVVNILASLLMVYGLGMKLEGVALGTVVAQYAGLLMAVGLLWRHYRRLFRRSAATVGAAGAGLRYGSFLRVNRDIFLRTLFLVAVNLMFTAAGAQQGALVLAINTVLMQLYLLFSYVLDGFAYAGEALGGRYWGARNWPLFDEVLRRLFRWAGVVTLLFTLCYVAGGEAFVGLLTDDELVRQGVGRYLPWACLIPLCGVAAFIWDGIFIGITATRGMLTSSILAAVVFFGVLLGLRGQLGNDALWLAQLLYLSTRGVVQTVLFRHTRAAVRHSSAAG